VTGRQPLTLTTVEVHAEGEPGRVVLDAAHLVEGDTMAERLTFCRERLQWLRELVLHEPRGYPALCAVLLLPPVTPGADFGVVLEQGGFTPMSGSNTMCAVAGAVASGLVTPIGPVLDLLIDTAVGPVTARADIREGRVVAVTVVNVPAFVVSLDTPLDVAEIGTVPADIVFGGQFFVQVSALDCGLDLDATRARDLVRAGALVKMAAREQVAVRHPLNPDLREIALTMLHSGPRRAGADSRNTVVLTQEPLLPDRPETWTGILDRSPCGTGTCARMAALHARGELAIGEEFAHRSIIGTRFVGRLTGTATVGGVPAVLPTVTGRTWVTGDARWHLDPDDPYPNGYTVADLWAPELPLGRQHADHG
jgi:proline racemase